MTTLIGAAEASRILDVTTSTLYAYVSRGRLGRTTAPDGRTSLYARDEVEALAARSRRAPSGPRATIDVQIRSSITTIDEHQLRYRGHDVATLVGVARFEDVAELLWDTDESTVPSRTRWPRADPDDQKACSTIAQLGATHIGMLAMAAHMLDARHSGDDARAAARRLLLVTPALLGSSRRTGPFALRLAAAWRRRPEEALVDAIDAVLCLLADHELATSTLAVRIAASVRTSPAGAFAAGLATVEGALHGSASAEAHRFLRECDREGAGEVVRRLRSQRERVPGFGHKVYRGIDPRFGPLMDRVRLLDTTGTAVEAVDQAVAEVGRVVPHQPNVDLALGALTWVAGLDPDTPLFAIARIAGWAAHYAEERGEPPVRFRGIARPR